MRAIAYGAFLGAQRLEIKCPARGGGTSKVKNFSDVWFAIELATLRFSFFEAATHLLLRDYPQRPLHGPVGSLEAGSRDIYFRFRSVPRCQCKTGSALLACSPLSPATDVRTILAPDSRAETSVFVQTSKLSHLIQGLRWRCKLNALHIDARDSVSARVETLVVSDRPTERRLTPTARRPVDG